MSSKTILYAGLYDIVHTTFGRQYQGAVITKEGKVLNYCNSSCMTWAKNDLGVKVFSNADGVTERCKAEQYDISQELGNSNWMIVWSDDDWLPTELFDKIKIGVANYQKKVRDRLDKEYKGRKKKDD